MKDKKETGHKVKKPCCLLKRSRARYLVLPPQQYDDRRPGVNIIKHFFFITDEGRKTS
jgi:hypothetical protein